MYREHGLASIVQESWLQPREPVPKKVEKSPFFQKTSSFFVAVCGMCGHELYQKDGSTFNDVNLRELHGFNPYIKPIDKE